MNFLMIFLMILLILFSLIVFILFWGALLEWKEKELIRICTEPDVDKLISLLEKGLDPNTKVKRKRYIGEYCCGRIVVFNYEPLIKVASDTHVQDLLIAYGAKTKEELEAEERAEEAKAAKKEEAERLARKAKKASDIAKVEAHLKGLRPCQ